jgi:glycerophosphoryl diester phosphodiesterase
VTAHRGFSGAAPENTLAAFQAAIDLGCDWIELDVRLSLEREVVVIHDDTLARTTNGRGPVAATPLAALKRLDAGAWFGPAFRGEPLPTLAEALTLARGRIGVNIELKGEKGGRYRSEELADRCLAEVRQAALGDRVLFSSFDPAALDRIRRQDPSLCVALITDRPWTQPSQVDGGRRYPLLHCRSATLTAAAVASAHADAVRVQAWTVNTPREMKRLLALGVDGIITNRPDRLLALLA